MLLPDKLQSLRERSSCVLSAMKAIPAPHGKRGVYFLMWEDVIIYVGVSFNVHERISQHSGSRRIWFDYVHWIHTEYGDDKIIEEYLIRTIRPKFNRGMKNTKPISEHKLQAAKETFAKYGIDIKAFDGVVIG